MSEYVLHVTYTTLVSSSKYHDKRRYAIFFIFHLFCQLLNPLDIFSILLHSRCPSHLCSIFLFLIFDWNSSLWLTLFLFNRELDDYNDVAATQHVFLHYLVVIRKKKKIDFICSAAFHSGARMYYYVYNFPCLPQRVLHSPWMRVCILLLVSSFSFVQGKGGGFMASIRFMRFHDELRERERERETEAFKL